MTKYYDYFFSLDTGQVLKFNFTDLVIGRVLDLAFTDRSFSQPI